MAKNKKISFLKLVLTGLFWTPFYFYLIVPFVGYWVDFDLLSHTAWAEKYNDFINYKWRVNTLTELRLLLVMLLWIPFWFIGWFFLYRVNWKKFKPAPRRRKIKRKVFELNENKPIYHMPRKMPSTVQASRYVAPKLPNQVETVAPGAKSHTNLVQMIRMVATLAKKYKVEIFQHILLEGNRVPLAISTDARAVLIEIVNKKNVNWSVEFTDDVTQSGWYSEGGVMERLAKDLLGASASLARSEPNSEILSAILIMDGRILNAKQAVEYFKSKGIFLIGYNNAEPSSELPDLASFLSAYFDLKPGETDPAPHPVQKVPLKQKQVQSALPAQSEQGTQQAQVNQSAQPTQAETQTASADVSEDSFDSEVNADASMSDFDSEEDFVEDDEKFIEEDDDTTDDDFDDEEPLDDDVDMDDDDIDEDQQDVGYSAELEQIKANFSMMMSGTEMEKEEKKEVLPEVTVDSQEKNKSKFRAPMPTKKS